jgi:hypothetical protein
VCVIQKYRRQGSGARKEDSDVAAQHALELIEEELVPKRRASAGAHGSFGCGKPRFKESLRDPPLGFHHGHDFVVDARVHTRHAGHNGGLQSRDVFSNKLSRITLKEANGGAAQEQQHLHVALKAISISIKVPPYKYLYTFCKYLYTLYKYLCIRMRISTQVFLYNSLCI